MTERSGVARRILQARRSRDMNQEEFAALYNARPDAVGVLRQTTLSAYERGATVPLADRFVQILELELPQ